MVNHQKNETACDHSVPSRQMTPRTNVDGSRRGRQVLRCVPAERSLPSLRIERPNASAPSTDPPSESSAMVAPSILFFLAKASKSFGVSPVIAPDAETQVRQSLPQACAGPSVQTSNCIGSARQSGAATGPELVASNRQVAAALAAAANRIIRRPPASGTMPERPPSSVLGDSQEFPRVTAQTITLVRCKSRTTHVAVHCYTVTNSGLVHFSNARWASCGRFMSGNDDIIKEVGHFSFPWWNRRYSNEKVP